MSRSSLVSIIISILLSFNISFGAFGDVINYYNLGQETYPYTLIEPVSVCFGDGSIWILESYVIRDSAPWYMWIYQYEIIAGTSDIKFKTQYRIDHHRSDLNGFCFVAENEKKYIWTTRCNFEGKKPQLYQIDIYTESDHLGIYRVLFLPSEYYPTGITLDNNLNIYFIDGMNRKVYKINYSSYRDQTGWITIESNQINELFTIPRAPSIPMGVEIDGLNFYITLAGENDYIIKTDMFGNEVAYKDLHDYLNSEHISRMPTDLTIDGAGYICYTDCDYDRLYKIQK
ncbi:MAG: hypothetical protein ACUVWP_07435 [bacterium]